jgi:hypothetical protein
MFREGAQVQQGLHGTASGWTTRGPCLSCGVEGRTPHGGPGCGQQKVLGMQDLWIEMPRLWYDDFEWCRRIVRDSTAEIDHT